MLLAAGLQAQTNSYQYKRDIVGTKSVWHSISIPNEVFRNTQPNLADVRIFGFNGKDTIEVPYVLKQNQNQITIKEANFNIINQSKTEKGFYYTFQTSAAANINQIKLLFKEENFDWKVILEGSNDNKEWFTVLNDYRILSIKNNSTNYQFTQLNFPTAKYSYFRIAIKTNKQPQLNEAKLLKLDTIKGLFTVVNFNDYQLINDAKNKQSILTIGLKTPTPISYLKLNIKQNYDFYREIKIDYATDSVKTEKGIQYNYSSIYEGNISSFEPTQFYFQNTFANKIRVTIKNYDNRPLNINSLQLKGPIYQLIGRFDEPNLKYHLYYGNKNAVAANYDLSNFEDKIPQNINAISVLEEQKNEFYSTAKITKPLFENKLWLYGLMVSIILLLGVFAFKMLKN